MRSLTVVDLIFLLQLICDFIEFVILDKFSARNIVVDLIGG